MNIDLLLSKGKHRNMLVKVLREPVIALGRNGKDADAPLTNAFPEPLGIENACTGFSIKRTPKLAYELLKRCRLIALSQVIPQENAHQDLQASSRHQTRKDTKDTSHPVARLLVKDHIALCQLPRLYSLPCGCKKSVVGMNNAFRISGRA
jgi:hypothetical protein